MTAWRIRRAGPADEATILAADVFDGPASREVTARFLGGSRDILMRADLDDRIVGFASGTVLCHPETAPSLFVQDVGVNDEARRQG